MSGNGYYISMRKDELGFKDRLSFKDKIIIRWVNKYTGKF